MLSCLAFTLRHHLHLKCSYSGESKPIREHISIITIITKTENKLDLNRIKIKARSFKSSERINEKMSGSYRSHSS